MKKCRICLNEKPLDLFPSHSLYKDGKETRCKVCLAAYRKEKWDNNLNVSRSYGRKYKAKNKAIIAERNKQYVEQNPEIRKATMKSYRLKTKPQQAAYVRKRQASLLQRTPAWLTADDHWMMEQAYELAALRTKMFGFKWHVDHILPLQGKIVSGLHVPTNLQVIPWLDNIKKHNRYEVTS